MFHVVFVFLLSILPHSLLGIPTDYAFTKVPDRFHSRQLTLGTRGLGDICFSRTEMPDGTVCNPVFLKQVEKSSLLGHLFVGNGYSAVSTAEKLIFNPLTQENLQSLFNQEQEKSVEGELGIVFTTRNFSAAFYPYRIQFLSEIHNPNFPVIGIHAARERSLVLATGIGLNSIDDSFKNFSFGIQVRGVERYFIHGSFSLFQALAEPPRKLLPSKQQTGIYIEPALAWQPLEIPWSFQTTLALQNLSKLWPEDPLYSEPLDFTLGIGVTPPVGLGKWQLGLDIVSILHAENFLSRFRLGTSYRLGIIEAMFGLNENSIATGVHFGFQFVQAGIVYEFYRNDFGGLSPGSKIATEISVKL